MRENQGRKHWGKQEGRGGVGNDRSKGVYPEEDILIAASSNGERDEPSLQCKAGSSMRFTVPDGATSFIKFKIKNCLKDVKAGDFQAFPDDYSIKTGFCSQKLGFTPKYMLKLSSILKIMLLWFQKMLCLISSKTQKLETPQRLLYCDMTLAWRQSTRAQFCSSLKDAFSIEYTLSAVADDGWIRRTCFTAEAQRGSCSSCPHHHSTFFSSVWITTSLAAAKQAGSSALRLSMVVSLSRKGNALRESTNAFVGLSHWILTGQNSLAALNVTTTS